MGGASGQSCPWGHPNDSLLEDFLCDRYTGVMLLERGFVFEQVPGTGRRVQISRYFSMVLSILCPLPCPIGEAELGFLVLWQK